MTNTNTTPTVTVRFPYNEDAIELRRAVARTAVWNPDDRIWEMTVEQVTALAAAIEGRIEKLVREGTPPLGKRVSRRRQAFLDRAEALRTVRKELVWWSE